MRPKLQWIEPVDIVNAAVGHRKRRLAGHPVTLDLDSNLPIVRADPAQVEQALVQILDNAAKYSSDGAPIRVAARPNGQAVVLSVHDCGAGLTGEEKRQVGGRFFRGPRHAATTSGSGLGLWIAQRFHFGQRRQGRSRKRRHRPRHHRFNLSAVIGRDGANGG